MQSDFTRVVASREDEHPATTRDNDGMSVLTMEERALLVEAVAAQRPDLQPLVAELVNGDRRLSADEGNALREAVGSELAQTGFDQAYEPTVRGRALEDLIDKLARVTAVFD